MYNQVTIYNELGTYYDYSISFTNMLKKRAAISTNGDRRAGVTKRSTIAVVDVDGNDDKSDNSRLKSILPSMIIPKTSTNTVGNSEESEGIFNKFRRNLLAKLEPYISHEICGVFFVLLVVIFTLAMMASAKNSLISRAEYKKEMQAMQDIFIELDTIKSINAKELEDMKSKMDFLRREKSIAMSKLENERNEHKSALRSIESLRQKALQREFLEVIDLEENGTTNN